MVGCRLCLSTEPRRNYFSLVSTEEFYSVKIALSLEADFSQLDIYPNHICQNCKDLLTTFVLFKKAAFRNEKFILQCQDKLDRVGPVDNRPSTD